MQPGTQLYTTNAEKLNEQVIPVKNSEQSAGIHKPEPGTGLWTSSWRESTRDSDWVEWCKASDYGSVDTRIWWLLTPNERTNLYTIESRFDLLDLLTRYTWETDMLKQLNESIGPMQEALVYSWSEPFRRPLPIERRHFAWIDFEKLAQEYDGIWLTEAGNASTHLSFPHNLNSWDCESILWFRWCFSDVTRIETPQHCTGCQER